MFKAKHKKSVRTKFTGYSIEASPNALSQIDSPPLTPCRYVDPACGVDISTHERFLTA